MKNQKGFVNPLGVALIAVLLIGSIFVIYKIQKVEAPAVVNTTHLTNNQTAPVNTQTDTSNWKTYEDTKYRFTYKYTGDTYGVNEIIPDIENARLADGACGGTSPEIYKADKAFTESNPVGTQTDKLESLFGLEKIYKTGSDVHALVTIQTCQGDYEDEDGIADVSIQAEIFKNNTLISLAGGLSGRITVRNVVSAASELLDGTYQGPEQESFNQFTKTISTFKFTEPVAKIDTSNWKTYTNAKYGFEIKLPSDWQVKVIPPDQYALYFDSSENLKIFDQVEKERYIESNYGGGSDPIMANISITNIDLRPSETLEEYMKGAGIYNYSKINFAGQTAFSFIDDAVMDETISDGIWIQKGNTSYKISFTSKIGMDLQLRDKILSTFKFTK